MSTEDGKATRSERPEWLPDWSVHPGEILGEWASERRITGAQIALMTGVSIAEINAILRGAAPVTRPIAEVLQLVTGITVQLWLGMQAAFDTHAARGARW